MKTLTINLLCLLPLVVLGSCGDGQKEKRGPRIVSIFMDGPIAETKRGTPFGPPITAHYEVLEHLREIREDKDVRGVFLNLADLGGGYAQFAELERAVLKFKQEGKKARPVHCHFDVADNRAFAFLAESCDRISMGPGGMINLVGVSSQMVYMKDLLDNIGVEAEVLHIGRYKGTGENLTRNESSKEQRETMNKILDAFQKKLDAAVGNRTGTTGETLQAIFDGGPYGSTEARALKLVDDVGFDDEALEHLRNATKTEKIEKRRLAPRQEEPTLTDLVSALVGSEDKDVSGERVALVCLSGTILDGSQDTGDADRIHSGPFVRKLRQLADDQKVKAIVLRVDSPGGSALASDRMWHAVRRAAGRKPVIASFGNIAASGGYYVASAADEIFSEQESLVGSIGVVALKPNFEGLLDKVGVHTEFLARGKNAGWLSPLKPLEESERASFKKLLERTYWRFIRRVATSRDMDRNAVLKVAGGRLMAGSAALQNGLVDKQGGLSEALARAKEVAKLKDDVEIEYWPRDLSLLEILQGGGGLGASASSTSPTSRLMRELSTLEQLATSELPLAHAPYWLAIR